MSRRRVMMLLLSLPAYVRSFIERVSLDGGTLDNQVGLEDADENSALTMLPNAYKDGVLYSVLPEDGTGDFDVVRGSSATRVNADGLIETMSSNEPRIDHTSGSPVLLTEPQSTNLIPYSEDFSDGSWSKTRTFVETATITSPDGLTSGYKLYANTNQASHWMEVLPFPTATSGQDVTLSLFVKSDGGGFIQIATSTGFPSKYQNFNTSTGTKASGNISSSSITDFGNGWYRISVTETTTGTNARYLIVPALSDITRNAAFQGNADKDGAYIWGAQIEEGSTATSYIPTSGAIATRLEDKVTGAGDVNTFNDSEGVLYFEGSILEDEVINQVSISDGTNDNLVMFRYDNSFGRITFFVRGGGGAYTITTINTGISKQINHKIALSWNGDLNIYVDGALVASTTINSLPIGLNELKLEQPTGGNRFQGNIKDLRVYPTALTDAELITLTTI